jgi:hypothetical protein
MKILKAVSTITLLTVAGAAMAQDMSFFVTSTNPNGGGLGGLAGADGYCEGLAATVGAGGKTWRAYLSTSSVDARDRIGSGPWYNANGDMIAPSVQELHDSAANLTRETALDQNGDMPGYLGGDSQPSPLEHDVLTGTNADGTANEATCNNWTDGSADSTAMLGHADRIGRNPGVNSWNAVHASQGCSLETLAPTGGAGLFYCFATD